MASLAILLLPLLLLLGAAGCNRSLRCLLHRQQVLAVCLDALLCGCQLVHQGLQAGHCVRRASNVLLLGHQVVCRAVHCLCGAAGSGGRGRRGELHIVEQHK
jgi:hypothetical protein